MAQSNRLGIAIHVMVNICLAERGGQPVSSAGIARSLSSNPSQIRQIMGKLRNAGLINTTQGSSRSTIARSAHDISMLDIYRALEGDASPLHLGCAVNPEHGVGQNVQHAIAGRIEQVRQAAESEMENVTLDGIVRDYLDLIGGHPGWDDPYSTGACLE